MSQPSYRLIDADTHVNEPPDLWDGPGAGQVPRPGAADGAVRAGRRLGHRGGADPINFGLNAAAGLPPRADEGAGCASRTSARAAATRRRASRRWTRTGVDAAVLYPTPRLSHAVDRQPRRRTSTWRMVQAYNDWLAEYCVPRRRAGSARSAAAEPRRGHGARRAGAGRRSLPGIEGVLIGCWPHGDLRVERRRRCAACEARAAASPLHIHVSMVDDDAGGAHGQDRRRRSLCSTRRSGSSQMVWSGVFDRLPDLKVVRRRGRLPAGCRTSRSRSTTATTGSAAVRVSQLERLPSAYIEEHFYFTYIDRQATASATVTRSASSG